MTNNLYYVPSLGNNNNNVKNCFIDRLIFQEFFYKFQCDKALIININTNPFINIINLDRPYYYLLIQTKVQHITYLQSKFSHQYLYYHVNFYKPIFLYYPIVNDSIIFAYYSINNNNLEKQSLNYTPTQITVYISCALSLCHFCCHNYDDLYLSNTRYNFNQSKLYNYIEKILYQYQKIILLLYLIIIITIIDTTIIQSHFKYYKNYNILEKNAIIKKISTISTQQQSQISRRLLTKKPQKKTLYNNIVIQQQNNIILNIIIPIIIKPNPNVLCQHGLNIRMIFVKPRLIIFILIQVIQINKREAKLTTMNSKNLTPTMVLKIKFIKFSSLLPLNTLIYFTTNQYAISIINNQTIILKLAMDQQVSVQQYYLQKVIINIYTR
eukprot:TRINITY_DN418_c4_g2_i1.p1 TRINITY_DN418_c4_g2~~TRINITY_DN418_c4_g2_i1.p1  ORF type:complete len:413 (-),score=-31.17 TRINITY_DN418_c4_g2_i1:117-1262(-)